MIDPLAALGRNDPCWCGSDRAYKHCHGRGPASTPGAPVPPDTDEYFSVSPTTRLARDAIHVPAGGGAVRFVDPTVPYRPSPAGITEIAHSLAAASVVGGPPDLAGLGIRRFEFLSSLGLDNVATVQAQAAALPSDVLDELAEESLLIARAGMQLLHARTSEPNPASAIYAPEPQVERLVGRSLLWADHYLIDDPLAGAALDGRVTADHIVAAIKTLLPLRPLIEAGLVVPIPASVARVATQNAVEDQLTIDLRNRRLMDWVASELVVEGPTFREVLFLAARDDIEDHARMYMYARVQATDPNSGQFTSKMLGIYEREHDYAPWIEQTKRQVAAQFIRELNERLAVADAFGGHLMTAAPFRGRLIREKQRLTANVPNTTAYIRVPHLEHADATTLARIASNEESVESMRIAMRRALRGVENDDFVGGARVMQHLVDDMVEDAQRDVARAIRRNRVWSALVPGGLSAAMLLGHAPAVATALSTAATLAPFIGSRAELRARPAWMFWQAERLNRRKGR